MTRALIIGSGIAGPVAAMALQRAGIDSVVYEAYEESAGLAAGAWLTTAVNGLDALRVLDLHRQVMACGFASGAIELRSGTGKLLGVVPVGGTLSDGTVTHTLERAELYRVLSDEAKRRGIRIEYGKRLVEAQVANLGGAVARFEDGSEARGDVLIGADGIHSRVRRAIDPAAPSPRYIGLGNIGGFARLSIPGMRPGSYQMIFGKRCFFGYTVSPSGEVWWFANPPRRSEIDRKELAALTSEQWKERLLGLLADDAGPAADIVRSTTQRLAGANQYDMPRVPTWRRGPMVIIGDAAHAASPSSGQGASMAVEDAVELARCLRDVRRVNDALAVYEQLRRERVERVVEYGAKFGNAKTAGPIGRILRDLMLPFFLKRAVTSAGDGSLSWLFNHHIGWDEPVARAA